MICVVRYNYTIIKNNYTYTFDYGKEIDDSEDLDWSVPAESLMNAILSF